MNKVISLNDSIDPKKMVRRYHFMVRENLGGGGFQIVLHAEDVHRYDTESEMVDALLRTHVQLETSINNMRHQLRSFNVENQVEMYAQGLDADDVSIWAEKLGIPKDYPPKEPK